MGLFAIPAKADDAYGGIGAALRDNHGKIEIMQVGKGTPADEGGLHIQDVIHKIDNKSTKDMSLNTACAALRGAVSSTVTIQFLGIGKTEPQEVKLKRVKINQGTIIWKKECIIIPEGKMPYVAEEGSVTTNAQTK